MSASSLPAQRRTTGRASGDLTDFSILGTTLVRVGELNEQGEGANVYYADAEALSLTLAGGTGTFPVSDPGDPGFRYCIESDVGPDLHFRIPEVACMRAGGRWFPARSETQEEVEAESPSECRACRTPPQATASILRGGRLTTFHWSYFGPTEIVWTVPSPSQCPSPNDTCGSREGFPTMSYDVARPYEGHYWIANDGAAALVGEHGGVLLRGETATVRAAGALALGDALGVHFYADVRPLLEGMSAYATARPAPPEGDCGHVAAAVNGAGAGAGVGAEDVDHDLVDTHGGRDFGARCTEHLRAGELDAAVRACERGLAIATEDRVRGALLFNLGRCAELRGAQSEARSFYERSLAVRPDNAVTREHLEALGE